MLLAKQLRGGAAVTDALQRAFAAQDEELLQQSRSEGTREGTTAVVCFVAGGGPRAWRMLLQGHAAGLL